MGYVVERRGEDALDTRGRDARDTTRHGLLWWLTGLRGAIRIWGPGRWRGFFEFFRELLKGLADGY